MDFKSGIVLVTLVLGSLALPKPDNDMSIFFDQTDPNARIVGGTEAPEGSHLHMVALSSGVKVVSFLCGASLVSVRSVLTAAHCIDAVFFFGSLSASLRVTVGTHRWDQGGTKYMVSGNATHPNYLPTIIKNDIGILYTATDVITSSAVSVIPLNYDHVGPDVESRVAGWGTIRLNGASPPTLLELIVNTIDGQACVDAVAKAAIDFNIRAPAVEPHIELCTFRSAGHGNCHGDSGSALVRLDSGEQIGVVSWTFPCARGAPDMYARVSGFQSWLQENVI